MPYVRVFDPAQGAVEHTLDAPRAVIGRIVAPGGILLEHPTVEREHAVLEAGEGGYRLRALDPRAGFLLNGNLTLDAVLTHGDMIQISHFIMEFRTDDSTREKDLRRRADTPVDRHVRHHFRLPPSGLQLRYRLIDVDPADIFSTGDTLPIAGGGGLLVPVMKPMAPGSCIELELSLPNDAKRRVLGEVQHTIESEGGPALAVKLHRKGDGDIQDILCKAHRGSWLAARPRPETT